MRIPSQFNQDSLYRRDNRQRQAPETYRRLIRLVIGLALVIVVMQQASRPAMYQTFFDPSLSATQTTLQGGDSGDPPQGAAGSQAAFGAKSNGAASNDVAQSIVAVSPEDRRIANQLIEDLLPTDQRQWVVALSRWQAGREVPPIPSSIESVESRLSTLESINEDQRAGWNSMLRSFAASASSDSSSPRSDGANGSEITQDDSDQVAAADSPLPLDQQDRPRVAAMLAVLDAAANSRVVDGSVWRSGDFDSLYRFLDQATDMPRTGVATTGVIPLLQQPDVFRNQWVRIEGAVARTERVDAEENPFGITHYWQLWLRPSGGADRPLVAIVLQIPDSVAAVGSTTTKMEGPEISVVGKYLKRLAYKSGIGADLAPVVVGQITSAPISESELEELEDTRQVDQPESQWWPIWVACLLGVGSAVFVMLRTSAAAKRARELRKAHRVDSDSFLHELGQSETDDSSTGEDQ